jgi:D-sedoheptulose 7-phosphate isomerase
VDRLSELREHRAGLPPALLECALAHLAALREVLDRVDPDALERIGLRLREARDRGATVFVAGNGGSAATAAHWVNDLGKATKRSGRQAMRAVCLSDNVAWLTALANDEGYERVFSGQLENFAREGDVLAVISASGSSPNLLSAVDVAHAFGVHTIGLVGFDGGELRERVSDCLFLPTERGAYELVEDAHGAICHALTLCLVNDRPTTAI